MTGDQLCTKLTELAKQLDGVKPVRFSLDLATAAATRLTSAQAFHILHIVQEAVSNSLRHSQGQIGLISLQKVGERVRVEVKDDGVGFIGEDAKRRGHGLHNMAMRAQKLGGTFRVIAHPGQGTRILVEFPQDAEDDSSGH
jgi:NarL family two-component system sensor histidine kinase LiaS